MVKDAFKDVKNVVGLKPPRFVYSVLAFKNAVAELVHIWSEDCVFRGEP